MLKAVLMGSIAIASIATAHAAPMPQQIEVSPLVETIADGCGWARYRGPGGACHRYGTGPFPGGYFGPEFWHPNECPPGYWRGPWGHCRDTEFHGYLPGGAYKP